MLMRCAPWPVKTKAVFPPVRVPRTTLGPVCPLASARRPVRSWSWSRPVMTARWSSRDRPAVRVQATSTGSEAVVVSAYFSSRTAWASRAAGVLPDSTHGTTGTGTTGSAAGATASSETSSMITWALVPLTPNAEMPARRGPPLSGQVLASVSSSTAPDSHSTNGVGASTCSVFGSTPCRIACTILITPPTPAAATECPMFDLNDPRYSGRPSGRPWPYVASSACASMGSPRRVPVPWASTASTSATFRRALARAWRITRSCEGPFGAVRPFDAPSWFTAEPRTTARTLWPFFRASDRRSRRTRPTPSDQLVPSAAAAKDLQRPSAARPRCRAKSTRPDGDPDTVTPPARAMVDSPCRIDCTARCMATSDDEQAVSIETAGPSKPNE